MSAARRGEAGVVMMFVLMAILLVGAVTLSVMQILTADVTGGIEEMEADQVFNIAQAGVHYAIGQLQLSNSYAYAGGTATITDASSNTLGTATITVNCIDTGASPSPNGCTSPYAGYRRIISTGSLPVAGPARKIVAIVQAANGGGTYAACGLQSVTIDSPGDPAQFYGDIGSNGSISISTTTNPPGKFVINADPNSPPQFAGVAKAVGTITCASGCATQVQGGVFPGQPANSVCSAPPPPTYAPGTGLQTVAPGTVFNINGTSQWGDINLQDSTTSGGSGNCIWTELDIHANPNPTDPPITVNMNTLWMGQCTRLVVLGQGKVNLLIGAATGNGLWVLGHNSDPVHFGVDQNDTWNKPSPLPNGQLTVWIKSNNMTCSQNTSPTLSCAGAISHATGSATIFTPNGSFLYDDSLGALGQQFNGPVVANQLLLTGWNNLSVGAGTNFNFSMFNKLMSWKDQ